MADYANTDDRMLDRSIDRWKQNAAYEVDDIGAWREAAEKQPDRKHWGAPPRTWYGDTVYLCGAITTRYAKLDPAPLMAIHEAVATWYTDRNAERIPAQSVLWSTLDRAMITLQAVEADIGSRMVDKPKPSDAAHNLQDAPADRKTWQDVQAELDALRLKGERFTSMEKMGERIGCSGFLVHKAIHLGTVDLQRWASKQRVASRLNAAPEVADIAFENTPQAREPDPADIVETADVDLAMAYLLDQADPNERARIHAMNPAERQQLAETVYRDPDAEEQVLRHRRPKHSRRD